MFLNCHSYHSLRYGTIPLNELVEQAAGFGVKAMALTDVNTVTGIYDFVKECRVFGIKPLVGMEFRSLHKLHFIAIAKHKDGIGEMCRLLTKHNFDGTALPLFAPDFNNVIIIYPIDNVPMILKDYEYIGIRPEQLTKLLLPEWKRMLGKMLVLQPVTFRVKKEFNLHKILRAIDTNIILSKLKEEDYCKTSEVMIPVDELILKYKNYPKIIKNTERVIEDCNFEFEFNVTRNKKFYTESKYGDKLLLENLAHQGLVRRYGKNNKEALARVLKELKVIDDLNFSSYFLITWDIIRFSKSSGFMHVGRGR